MSTPNPNINGYEYDHTSSRIRIDGQVEPRIASLTYGGAFDGVNDIYGTSIQPIGQTRGRYKPKDPTLELYLKAWIDLRARFGDQLLTKRFVIVVELNEPGVGFITDVIHGCRIIDHENSTTEGGEAQKVKLSLKCFYVLPDKKNPFPGFRR